MSGPAGMGRNGDAAGVECVQRAERGGKARDRGEAHGVGLASRRAADPRDGAENEITVRENEPLSMSFRGTGGAIGSVGLSVCLAVWLSRWSAIRS